MSDELKVICAWCNRHMSGPADAPADRVTHTVCKDCKVEQLRLLDKGKD